MKTTARAPSNVAFIKYWGRMDEKLRLPTNGSISMNLSNLTTTTTVQFDSQLRSDEIVINGTPVLEKSNRVSTQLDRIRKLANVTSYAKVASQNTFPQSTGLSSSASAFAALTVSAAAAAGLHLSEKKLSILARLGSGSACRSIPDGFVEWRAGKTSQESYACSLFPPEYWDICDIVVVFSRDRKAIPTSKGQEFTKDNPFFETRLRNIENKITLCKSFITNRDFKSFGELVEREALELHAIMLTSNPPLIYFTDKTVALIHKIQTWRSEGLPVYFTLNTGQNAHILCRKKNAQLIIKKLSEMPDILETIENVSGIGTRIISQHLF